MNKANAEGKYDSSAEGEYDPSAEGKYDQILTIIIPRYKEDQKNNYKVHEVLGLLVQSEEKYSRRSHENRIYKKTLKGFLTLPPGEMGKIAYGYLNMCETIASQLYFSMVINNGHLKYHPSVIIDDKNTIQNTFDKGFINMLKSLLNTRWRNERDKEQNQILINGIGVDDEECFEKLKDTPEFLQKISIEKTYLNLFFTLFMRNSLDLLTEGGHISSNHRKIVSIEIGMNAIRITDIPVNYKITEDCKKECQEKFQEKDIFNRGFDFKYKTIRAFSGLIEEMNVYGYDYKLDCGFNEDGNFFLELKFQKL